MISKAMTVERPQAFNDAWGKADIPALMSFMGEDCIYQASVGPEPGTTFSERIEVERGFREMLAYEQTHESKSWQCFVMGNVGLAEWSYIAVVDGQRTEVRGCDIFGFEGDLITRKDAFRKVLG